MDVRAADAEARRLACRLALKGCRVDASVFDAAAASVDVAGVGALRLDDAVPACLDGWAVLRARGAEDPLARVLALGGRTNGARDAARIGES